MINNIPDALWEAYLATRFEVILSDGSRVVLSVGEPATGLAGYWQGNAEAFIVTAHNPLSQRLPPAENKRREMALQQRVDDYAYRFFTTNSVDILSDTAKKWPDESGVLIFGATIRAAIQLAAEFQQYAIVRVPRVGLVECLPVDADQERPQY